MSINNNKRWNFRYFATELKNKNMSLTDNVNEGIKTAMKAKDEPSLRAYRAIKAALLLLRLYCHVCLLLFHVPGLKNQL